MTFSFNKYTICDKRGWWCVGCVGCGCGASRGRHVVGCWRKSSPSAGKSPPLSGDAPIMGFETPREPPTYVALKEGLQYAHHHGGLCACVDFGLAHEELELIL